ncbi:uncharacterized protein PRCAT00000038001 [Priceomyces carsonii]|uniref:uncharacterized protein n=1 Tax=Priceomyces carsonii TaxID=28549 RepID=UPI002ED98441|nr:unnamed protein product [Priceomyces carsonii]
MQSLNIEDFLEEFDVRYMESYNQVVNGTGGVSLHDMHKDISSIPLTGDPKTYDEEQKSTLSSPLLGSTSTFTQSESFLLEPSFTSKDDNYTQSLSNMRPPLKPSVTIASINTIAKFQRNKLVKRSNVVDTNFSERSVLRRRHSVPSKCVGNPFYKRNRHLSTSSVPIQTSVRSDLDASPTQCMGVSCQQKRRKPSQDLHLNLNRRYSAGSDVSSVDSYFSLVQDSDDSHYEIKSFKNILLDE